MKRKFDDEATTQDNKRTIISFEVALERALGGAQVPEPSPEEIPPPPLLRRERKGYIKFLPGFHSWIIFHQNIDRMDELIRMLYQVGEGCCNNYVKIDELYTIVGTNVDSMELLIYYDRVLDRLLEYGIVDIG